MAVRIRHLSRFQLADGRGRAGGSQRQGLSLCIEADGSHQGHGEASPLEGWSARSVDEIENELRGFPWRSAPAGLSPAKAANELTALLRGLSADARFAAGGALLDLWSRRAGISLSQYLAPDPAAAREVPCYQFLRGDHVEEWLPRLSTGTQDGAFLHCKMKWPLDSPGDRFAGELERLCGHLAGRLRIRLDINGQWDKPFAGRMLRQLASLPIEYVEEPVRGGELLELDSPIPLAADESALDDQFRTGLLEQRGAVRFVILKPAFTGSPLESLERARDFRQAGLRVVITHVFGGAVGHAHAVAIAQALADTEFHGLAWPYAGTAVPAGLIWNAERDAIALAGAPGMGLDTPP
ncbi:MAG: o-succinylbenzoate synthase [Myxococcota bacterium]|nr:o-succinylbenzoate synthase [Myxococcota bacterium]